nr:MAG TPA: hypothetical protein [Bacteriophage sp.]
MFNQWLGLMVQTSGLLSLLLMCRMVLECIIVLLLPEVISLGVVGTNFLIILTILIMLLIELLFPECLSLDEILLLLVRMAELLKSPLRIVILLIRFTKVSMMLLLLHLSVPNHLARLREDGT